jgi:protein SCO1
MSRTISLQSTWLRAFATTLSALLILACGRTRPPDGTRRHPVTGVVVDRDEIHSQLTIAHNAVEGLMPSMTMPFRIANLKPQVQPGDQIKGTLVLTPDGGWIEDLTITHKSTRPVSPPPVHTMAEAGTEVPDFALKNQDGKPISLGAFRGQSVILTFIYTRCPFPDYCPLMMKDFNAVKRDLAKTPALERRVHLLSISIDPEFDTPAVVLRAYGKRLIPGVTPFERWDFATGSDEEIRRIATWFGLTYFYEAGQIQHSLSTAIIDANGRLVQLLPSNSWRPEDAVATLARISQ